MNSEITCASNSNDFGLVMHVFDHSFPIGDGYAYRSGEIIRFLRQLGWQTIHITSAKQGKTSQAIESIDGLEFHRTQPSAQALHKLPLLDQWSVVTTLRKRLSELVKQKRPALLHVHSPCLNGIAALSVANSFGIPIIYEVRSLWEDAAVDSGATTEGSLRYRLSRFLETYVCRKVDHIVTICEGLREELIRRGIDRSRVTVAPNSVDLDRFARAGTRDEIEAQSLGLTKGKTFGFIGTFFPFEGLDVLLRAVTAIRARDPQVRFVLVGDGPEYSNLQALAQSLGIMDAVVFTGRIRHSDVEKYYDLIDILVYPRVSKRITELVTPLKPLEAMAKNKLVVASNVGGHREMVFTSRNGVMFAAGDSNSLADVCNDLLSRPEKWDALREGGNRYVSEHRSWKQNIKVYHRVYEHCLQNVR